MVECTLTGKDPAPDIAGNPTVEVTSLALASNDGTEVVKANVAAGTATG